MTSFEFVFGMISVITSLALTRLLGDCVRLLRHLDRVTLSWRHACWTAVGFMILIGNWASFWQQRNIQSWGALDILVPLIFIGVLYAFCDLLMPDMPGEGGSLDLREYHASHGRRYVMTHLVFASLAMLVIARNAGSFEQWLGASRFALVAAAASTVALFTRRAWLDTAAATLLALLAVLFMWTRLEAIAA